jgi:hypothetical protein
MRSLSSFFVDVFFFTLRFLAITVSAGGVCVPSTAATNKSAG